MEAQTLQLSVVIAGVDNNPTVLNPDFLRYNDIVPDNWGWELSAPPICTPPFAQVAYNSGVTIAVDPTKIQIVDKGRCSTLANTRILDIAKKYVAVLRHVAYSATGLNFTAYIPVENPSDYLKERFIRADVWDTSKMPIDEVGLRFIFPLEKGKINFSIDPGEVVPSSDGDDSAISESVASILVNVNFHRDCLSTYPHQADEVLKNLECASQDADEYQNLLNEILLSK